MSLVTNAHAVVPFDAKTSKPFDGQRLAKVTYKTPRSGNIADKKQSICVSIPIIAAVDITDHIQSFVPHIVALCKSSQDSIIKELYEAGASNITDGDISVGKILDYLAEESKGNRLTKEIIVDWFDASLADILTVAFAEKMAISDTPTDVESKRLEQTVNVYRDKLASLAGGKTCFPADVAIKLQKALELADSDDVMAQRFRERLVKMQQNDTIDLLGL